MTSVGRWRREQACQIDTLKALVLQARLHREAVKLGRDPQSIEVVLVSRSTQVLPQHSIAVRKIFEKLLAERKVEVQLARQVTGATATDLLCSDGQAIPFDEAIWCTQGGAQEWLRGTNLALDNAGFIAVHPSLESINTPDVFAAGDVAAVLEHPRPKAGVFAVRQGPPLTANLRSRLLGRAVKPFVPQTRFLGLIGAGDGNCVASKGPMALEGRWLWDLKDWIDRTWMAMYSHALPQMGSAEPPPPEVAKAAGAEALQALSHTSMRCGGCGAKVGATVLSRVMARLKDGGHLAGEQAGAAHDTARSRAGLPYASEILFPSCFPTFDSSHTLPAPHSSEQECSSGSTLRTTARCLHHLRSPRSTRSTSFAPSSTTHTSSAKSRQTMPSPTPTQWVLSRPAHSRSQWFLTVSRSKWRRRYFR